MPSTLPIDLALFLLGAGALFCVLAICERAVAWLARWCGIVPKRPVYGAARSGKWPRVERAWLAVHPTCAACGGKEQVSVHHKRPFHLHPELELDAANLISLCERHCCHLMIGHSGDWHAYNSHVEDDARIAFLRVQKRRYE